MAKVSSACLVLAGLLLAACCPPTVTPSPEPTATPVPTPPTSPTSPVSPLSTPEAILPVAVMAAEQDLSASLGVPVEEIQVVSYEQREWPDACLGLASEGEVCAQVITPGWQVVLRAQGEQYVFRTDEDGQVVRQEE
jgi:hypothetical protein